MTRRTVLVLTLTLLVWSAVATAFAAYYFTQYTQTAENLQETSTLLSKVSMKVNVCINYGNGTVIWHNETLVPVGASAFNATVAVAKVSSTYYEGLGEFVESIDKVEGNKTHYWSFWYQKDSEWVYSEVGASAYILHDGNVIGWRYTKVGEEQPPS